jgi:hypothetical protein
MRIGITVCEKKKAYYFYSLAIQPNALFLFTSGVYTGRERNRKKIEKINKNTE